MGISGDAACSQARDVSGSISDRPMALAQGLGCDPEHPGSHTLSPRALMPKDSDSVDSRPCRNVRAKVNGRQAMGDMLCFLRKTVPTGTDDPWDRLAVGVQRALRAVRTSGNRDHAARREDAAVVTVLSLRASDNQ
jgi:hypothetical protein